MFRSRSHEIASVLSQMISLQIYAGQMRCRGGRGSAHANFPFLSVTCEMLADSVVVTTFQEFDQFAMLFSAATIRAGFNIHFVLLGPSLAECRNHLCTLCSDKAAQSQDRL